jgi:hypothetical protein
MLLIQSSSLALALGEGARLRLLDALASRGLTPLLRSSRRLFFQLLAAHDADTTRATEAAEEIERGCAERHDPGRAGAYTPGELFSAGDCLLYLVFGAGAGLSAGVVYNVESAEPLAQLERFCRDVRESLNESGVAEGTGEGVNAEQSSQLSLWRARGATPTHGLARFMAIQPDDFVRASAAFRGGRELTRASRMLEERSVRLFLQRVQELRREGYTPRRLFTEATTLGVSVAAMSEAGLLAPEVRVSCRKTGHALFDLPSPDSLAAITISRAKCSLCAAPVADEVIEETINPTPLAVALLEDGRWLTNRIYKIVRGLGVPGSEIMTGPSSQHGESYLAANACGNSFLFVTKDGDLTPAFCRRAVETVEETDATHLVVVVTGAAEDEGRLRLYEFAWRRARDGRDLGVTLVEGLGAARAQIERAFESAARRELSRNLFALDAALGFSASGFVLDWFKLLKASRAKREAEAAAQEGAKKLAASVNAEASVNSA